LMTKRMLLLLSLWLALAGCAGSASEQVSEDQVSEEHVRYLGSFGWHIKKKTAERTEVIDYFPERMKSLQIAGLDLEPYKNQEMLITTYELKETQSSEDKNERKMYASIYEMNGTIIGGFGSLEGWTPGYFALADKERLIRDGIMEP